MGGRGRAGQGVPGRGRRAGPPLTVGPGLTAGVAGAAPVAVPVAARGAALSPQPWAARSAAAPPGPPRCPAAPPPSPAGERPGRNGGGKGRGRDPRSRGATRSLPACCRCRAGPLAVVGRRCSLYPRGAACGATTEPGDDAEAARSRDAEGRWEVAGSPPSPPPPQPHVPAVPGGDPRLLARRSSPSLGPRIHGAPCSPVQRALLALALPLEMLQALKGRMLRAMREGLSRQTHARATVRMLPTYICSTPDGTEKGDILVVELGHNYIQTVWVNLLGDGNQNPRMTEKIFDMPEDIKQGKGEMLFDFIAQCVYQFLKDIGNPQQHIPLGFIFPFSCRKQQLDKAELISWSKGFSCSDMEGKDVVQLLQSCINKQEIYHVEVVALINDTVGTMMTCSIEGKPCEVALTVGSGTNSCFMIPAQLVEMAEETSRRMCVNTEWGCFGDDGTLSDVFTSYDQSVDHESSNPGERRFEKLVSSLYLGEITRHVLIGLTAEKALFIGNDITVLKTKGALKTQQVLGIISKEDGMIEARMVLEALGLQPSEQDCCRVQQICRAVVSRAAALCAAGLAAILSYMCQAQELEMLLVNVGVDGDLYRGYSRFKEILQSVTGMLSPECMATFLPLVGSTGRGAAIITAVALRLVAKRQEVDKMLAPLRLSRADLQRVQALMRQEMELGLLKENNGNTSLRMLPTYVRNTPDGTERGEFLALDLGGTNFRVLVVRVAEDIRITSEIYIIPTAVTQGTGEALFDHIIDCMRDFQMKQDLKDQVLPLGFTFSFPCQQLGLNKAVLLSWTKGFNASGCVGQDVVQLLQEAAQRKNFGLNVVAVVNDTVGTMMSCAYDDPKCEIGLIVGTGTNACYMEEMRNVGSVEGEEGLMCINMEWGAFGDNGCLENIFTDFDLMVDKTTINVGRQRFEKLISGMYLGEIVRHILLAMMDKQLLFCGKPCPQLQTKDIFKTKFLSTIEIDGLALSQVQRILQNLELQPSFEDSALVREVCETVSLRAAQLCGAGMAAVVEKMWDNRGLDRMAVTVGADGTLYKMHPHFSQRLKQTVEDLAPNCTVTFLRSEDGSGKGAALVAAVAWRTAEPPSPQ
ncbi:hexokinase-3 [Phaenicophaeus curvirostris]|uniref:hexokinase-3 n=1 Tax=Phaenicophaeus curvirostris TaxID=33595 RepID=UPI0037F0E9F8